MLIAGTGTDVGKTWVCAALLRELRSRGCRVAARKPVQSGQPGEALTDADVLAAASGDSALDVCPPGHTFEVPMTPFMAAAVLARPLPSLAALVGGVAWPIAPVDVGLVESVGGVRSPITEDGEDTLTMASVLVPDLTVLVADAGLGTLNLVRLSLDVLGPGVVTYLNRFDPVDDLHCRNRDWLVDRLGVDVVTTVPALADRVAPPL